MSRRDAGRRTRASRTLRPGASSERKPTPSLGLFHPASLVVILVAFGCVALSTTFVLYETDFWQQLAAGRAIAQLHRVPTTQLWTWPTYGAPDVNSSWGFEALIWPIWEAAGVWGLYAWRWSTALLALGLGWAAARTMGARGLTPLVVVVLGALTYRQRAHIRPESLAGVLFALEIWVLEAWRQRALGAGPTPSTPSPPPRFGGEALGFGVPLVAIALVWANAHLSYFLGLGLLAAHLIESRFAARGGGSAVRTRGLLIVAGAALLVSFVNPFGWRALSQPFSFALAERREPIYQSIPELDPLDLATNLRNLLPIVLVGWPVVALWRARRLGFDRVEALLAVGTIAMALTSHRFLGFAMVAATPYLGRDLDAWVRTRRWPRWTARSSSRAVLATSACVLMGLPEWSRPDLPFGVGIRMQEFPVAACDFIAAHGIEGRIFNQFYFGGYLLHRFWPDRGRLPFIDTHQAGTPSLRAAYSRALLDERAWHDLDLRYRFDVVVLRRFPYPGDRLLDFLDADTTFALVFLDDAAALYARREGALRELATTSAYRVLPAGPLATSRLSAAVVEDSSLARRVERELGREAASSPYCATALLRLGNLAAVRGDYARGRALLGRALDSDPRAPHVHERLGLIALADGRAREALRELEREHSLYGWFRGYGLRTGQAYRLLGDPGRARARYRAEIARDPGNQEALDSLRALGY